MKVTIDSTTGTAVVENQVGEGKQTWTIPASQVEAHMRGVVDTSDHPFKPLAKGDQSALKDMAADYANTARLDERNR